jgi:hypothetical protein
MRLFRIVLLCLVSSVCWAQAAPPQTPQQRVETFLKQVAAGQSDQAIDQLSRGSGMAELKPQALQGMKSQTKAAMEVYGTAIGFEKIQEVDFSGSLKRFTYLQKFERYPVIWEVYFYKPKDTWVINQIVFNDQPGVLLGAK